MRGKKIENIDLDIRRSTVSITKLYTFSPFSSVNRGRVCGSGLQHLGRTLPSPQAEIEA